MGPNNTVYYRVCSCGCGRPLKKKDGSPDFTRRRFANPRECLAKDKCNRLASKRAHAIEHPGPRISINGTEIASGNQIDLVRELRKLGLDVSVIRQKRTQKAKA